MLLDYVKCLEDADFALFNTGKYSVGVWIMQNKQKSSFSKNILMFTLIFKYDYGKKTKIKFSPLSTVTVTNTNTYFVV